MDSLQTDLTSLQLFDAIDKVQPKQNHLTDLHLLSSCPIRRDGLSDAIADVNTRLARSQRKRYDIAQDRIEYEKVWSSVFWKKSDAIQDSQLELDLNTFSALRRKWFI
jgi:hypothetical protein